MAALLTDALKPNLVQTLEGRPAIVHAGPFANIAHGNNSIVADRLGLKLGDYVVTESGFGADMGFEKFVDIVCRGRGLAPSVVVLVATAQALKHHGGDPNGGVEAIERGADNLEANMRIVREFGIVPVVAVNRFPDDDPHEVDAICRLALEFGAFAAEVNDGFTRGGSGAVQLAEVVVEAATREPDVHPLYELDAPIPAKIEAIATRAYGASGIELSATAARQAQELADAGLDRVPVCMAKTHLSLSHDPALGGTPKGFTLPVRELRPYTGAGWVVALCGDMQTMPGLPAEPAAKRIGVDADGLVTGLR
jgi:formyltetrahydrofolate synthetase